MEYDPNQDLRQATIDTYNKSAEALAEYFRGIGPRARDIDLAIELAGNVRNPKIVEIGCGDGRDAREITSRTDWYLGFDIAQEMITLAEKHVPKGLFETAGAANFNYPPDVDIVFAFASLLHVSKEELVTVFEKVAGSLRQGGIFFISTKHAPDYRQVVQEDQFGRRLFYYYNEQLLKKIAGDNFETIYEKIETKGTTNWIELALKKT